MGGKKSRQKGNRAEYKIVEKLNGLDWNAQRVPNSGSSRGAFSGDLIFTFPDRLVGINQRGTGEVKARRDGAEWKRVREWLGRYEALFLVQDRQEPLVLLPWRVFESILGKSGGNYEC